MKYLLSMDGGGSKTQWLLTTEDGSFAGEYRTTGCSHPELGVPAVLTQIHEGIDTVTRLAGCTKDDIIGAAFGVPCYGEYPDADKIIENDLRHYLSETAVSVHNDVELGFAGSLCLEDGIHVVAGTGAIAIGRNKDKGVARSGGWHHAFSDEGSGYWLGMHTLGLFTKESDCRAPRSSLYTLIRDELGLADDGEIIAYYNKIEGDRRQIAALQRILCRAAEDGDTEAEKLFEQAAYEHYLAVLGVYRALKFSTDKPVPVSYSGGLFADDGRILPHFTRLVGSMNAELRKPCLPPSQGGILLAMQNISKEKAKKLVEPLRSTVK